MSKAFLKEDANDEEADPEPDDRAPRGSELITPEGYRALGVELDRLWKVDRPKVTEEVAAAAAQGDRSENAEYIYGKKKLREIDRRIRWLTKRLETVQVVGPISGHRDRIYFGAWFTIEDEDGQRASYRIVGTDELNLAERKISVKSPLAQALIGKRKGELVTVQRPKGANEVTVIKIWYES